MSTEIKLQSAEVRQGIASLRASIEAMDTSFAQEIEGENDLDMVTAFNDIKQEYEELLERLSVLFLENMEVVDDAVENLEETDQKVADAIKNRVSVWLED